MGKTLDQFPEHLQRIGLLAVEANHIDALLETLFRTLTGLEQKITYAIFGEISSQRLRRDIITQLIGARLTGEPQLLADWEPLNKRLAKFSVRRAAIVHSVYSGTISDKAANPITYDPHEVETQRMPINELEVAITKVRELTRDLRHYGIRVLNWRKTAPNGRAPSRNRPNRQRA